MPSAEAAKKASEILRRAMTDALRGLGAKVLSRDIAELSGDDRRKGALAREVTEIINRLKTESAREALGRPLADQYAAGYRTALTSAIAGRGERIALTGPDVAVDARKLLALAEVAANPLRDAARNANSPLPYIAPRLDDLSREKLLRIALAGEARGLTWAQLAKEIAAGIPGAAGIVKERGNSALWVEFPSDEGRRAWSAPLERYANTLARTKSVWAGNKGVLDRCDDDGIELVSIPISAGAVDFCLGLEGKVYALSDAAASDYGVPLLSSTPNGGPPFHPNCRHSLAPFSTTRKRAGGAGARAELPKVDESLLTGSERGSASSAQAAWLDKVKQPGGALAIADALGESAARRGFGDERMKLAKGNYRGYVGKPIPGLAPGQKEVFKKESLTEDAHLMKRIELGHVQTRAEYRQKIADTIRNANNGGNVVQLKRNVIYHDPASDWVVSVNPLNGNVQTGYKLEKDWPSFIKDEVR